MPSSLPVDTAAVPGVVPDPDPFHVVVILPDRRPADHPSVLSELARHTHGRYLPYPIYPLRRAGRRPHRRHRAAAWTVVRRPDGVTVTAGGARKILDLQGLARAAGWQAQQRWQAWRTLVAAGTPRAREWESFLTRPDAQQSRPSRALSLDEARARFEAQPRVLAMLAVNGEAVLPFPLDPYELAAYQAGERVYCTVAARQAVVGQMLVLPGGFAYRPVTTGIAHRLRYQHAALHALHALNPDQHLAAVIATAAA